jgi:hypothetical protein
MKGKELKFMPFLNNKDKNQQQQKQIRQQI